MKIPQAPVPPLEEINSHPEFRAREMTKEKFEILWEAASTQCQADPQDHHHIDELARWMVVHEDTHGNRGLTKSDLTEPEADAILARFAQNKPHKQEYYKFSYTPSTRRRVILRERILE